MAKLTSNLTKIAAAMPGAASEALLQTGVDVFDISQQLVPVRTGKLKASGGVEVESSSEVIVGYGSQGSEREDVALFIEYGTENMEAQPYLTPAFNVSEDTFRRRFAESAAKAAEREIT